MSFDLTDCLETQELGLTATTTTASTGTKHNVPPARVAQCTAASHPAALCAMAIRHPPPRLDEKIRLGGYWRGGVLTQQPRHTGSPTG